MIIFFLLLMLLTFIIGYHQSNTIRIMLIEMMVHIDCVFLSFINHIKCYIFVTNKSIKSFNSVLHGLLYLLMNRKVDAQLFCVSVVCKGNLEGSESESATRV